MQQFLVWKEISSELVRESVALITQYAKRMRVILLSSVADLNVTYFFHLISYTARICDKSFEQ